MTCTRLNTVGRRSPRLLLLSPARYKDEGGGEDQKAARHPCAIPTYQAVMAITHRRIRACATPKLQYTPGKILRGAFASKPCMSCKKGCARPIFMRASCANIDNYLRTLILATAFTHPPTHQEEGSYICDCAGIEAAVVWKKNFLSQIYSLSKIFPMTAKSIFFCTVNIHCCSMLPPPLCSSFEESCGKLWQKLWCFEAGKLLTPPLIFVHVTTGIVVQCTLFVWKKVWLLAMFIVHVYTKMLILFILQ